MKCSVCGKLATKNSLVNFPVQVNEKLYCLKCCQQDKNSDLGWSLLDYKRVKLGIYKIARRWEHESRHAKNLNYIPWNTFVFEGVELHLDDEKIKHINDFYIRAECKYCQCESFYYFDDDDERLDEQIFGCNCEIKLIGSNFVVE